MKKKVAFFLLLLSIISQAKDDVWRTDSAYAFCVEFPNDTAALSELNSHINRLFSINPDTAFFYATQQRKLAKRAKNNRLESRALNAMGICMEYKGRPDSAISFYHQALDVALQTTDQKLHADTYNNLGIVYSLKGLFELSLEYTLKALEIYETKKDTNGMAALYNNIGLRYSELQNQNKAIEYYNLAIQLNSLLNNTRRLGSNHLNLGRSFFLKEMFDSSKVHYLIALTYSKETKNNYNIGLCYSGLAFVFMKSDEIKTSQQYADSALAIATEVGDESGIHSYDLISGYIYNKLGKPEKAIQHLLDFETWSENARMNRRNFEMYYEISNTYKDLGNYRKALDYMTEFAFIKDTVFNNQKDLALEQISIYKLSKEEKEKELLNQQIALQEIQIEYQKSLRNTFVIIGILLLLIAIGIANRFFTERKNKKALAEKNTVIQVEKERSEQLLLNILPAQVAEELKIKGESLARDFDEVTVLFTDFEEFTIEAERLEAHELVKELNTCFKAFDTIVTDLKLEKIKTIGDAYMAASGLHMPRNSGAREAVYAALKMQEFMVNRNQELSKSGKSSFTMRAGIHTGPVVAGIVGVKKFQYDIWGDTVNTASRMENNSIGGKVNISQATYELIKDLAEFEFDNRGEIEVKGKGKMQMWFVNLA